jgi:hypothetical protein
MAVSLIIEWEYELIPAFIKGKNYPRFYDTDTGKLCRRNFFNAEAVLKCGITIITVSFISIYLKKYSKYQISVYQFN